MDYKDTLLLPNTEFPMRGNLPENEPKRLKSWFEDRKIYEKMKAKRQKAAKSFTLADWTSHHHGFRPLHSISLVYQFRTPDHRLSSPTSTLLSYLQKTSRVLDFTVGYFTHNSSWNWLSVL